MSVTEKPSGEQEVSLQRAGAESRALPDDYWEGELVPRTDPCAAFISVNPERMSGTPCFVGTRVPIKHLWDYLEGSDTLEEFLDDWTYHRRHHAPSAEQPSGNADASQA